MLCSERLSNAYEHSTHDGITPETSAQLGSKGDARLDGLQCGIIDAVLLAAWARVGEGVLAGGGIPCQLGRVCAQEVEESAAKDGSAASWKGVICNTKI